MKFGILLYSAVFLCLGVFGEDTPTDLERQGKAFLTLSQTDGDALVPAARFFGKAAIAYEAEGNTDKTVEMNSFLYWCKKKMTMQDIKSFVAGEDVKLAQRLEAVEKSPVKPEDAQGWLERAIQFEKNNPAENYLVAVRYFEVADRFKGSDISLKAQELSLAAMQKTTTPTAGAKATAATAQPKSDVQGDRKPAPDAKALADAESAIKDIFKDEYAKTKPADKEALSKKLAQQAEETKDDAASEYMLWRESALLAAQAGAIHPAIRAIDSLSTHFSIDAVAQKRAVLTTASSNTKDPEVVKLITSYRNLLDKPEDPMANTIVGRSLFLTEKAWDKAFSHLVKGGDANLKRLAEKEISGVTTTEARIELADAWFDYAEKETVKTSKQVWYERASIWYNAAAPEAKGLAKTKIEKRIATIAASSAGKPVAAAKGAAPAPGVRPVNIAQGITIEMQVDGVDRLWFKAGEMYIQHMSFNRPIEISIDGVKTILKFDGTGKSQVIPLGIPNPRMLSFAKKEGRGRVKVLDSTAEECGLEIDDSSGMSSYVYKLKLSTDGQSLYKAPK